MVDCTDWSDPCAVLPLMRQRYYALVSGESVKELRHNGKVIINATTRASDLLGVIRELERACAEKKGLPTAGRFAFRAG
jgi:hypothetical protein